MAEAKKEPRAIDRKRKPVVISKSDDVRGHSAADEFWDVVAQQLHQKGFPSKYGKVPKTVSGP